MKNREKYAEQIIDMALNDESIAVKLDGNVLCKCEDITCEKCIGNGKRCSLAMKAWAEQEYIETTVDWSKVPVDTKILVRDSENDLWERKYFAKYENNKVYAWSGGTTSYSSYEYNKFTYWAYAKLAEEDV